MRLPTSIISEGRIDSFRAGKLNVHIFESRQRTGKAAAEAVAAEMRRLTATQGRAIGVFASAPSHNEFLDELVKAEAIEWTRVIGFHLDEQLGANEDAPHSHRRFLLNRLVKRVPMAEFHGLRGEAANPEAVCANYAALLKSRPPDFAALDLGENGCLASINHRACDFNDPAMVRIVELDDPSRRAISLTIPVIMACPKLFLIAPATKDETKQEAVRRMLKGEMTTACPASILRTHEDAHVFLDRNSAAKLAR
ncbi:MAG: 6-phosphogluconolactonase [Blastocatellales bacterium]